VLQPALGRRKRRRVEAELAKERDSAAFLAHVTALEWTRKQELERERVLAATDTAFHLSCSPLLGVQASQVEEGEGKRGRR